VLFLPLRSTIFLALLIVGLALLAVSPNMHGTPNHAMTFRQAQGPELADGQRTATRCAITFSNDQNTSTPIDARFRQPSLILFSLDDRS
jgi:hypothetical protein